MGLEMGLLTLDDLRAFLTRALRKSDVPYIFTDVFLSLDKGQEAVTDVIFYNLQGHYKADRSAGNTVQRALIGIIRDKYRSGQIDKGGCVQFLHNLTNYSDCEWNLLAIAIRAATPAMRILHPGWTEFWPVESPFRNK